jgi:hypothetical protein
MTLYNSGVLIGTGFSPSVKTAMKQWGFSPGET